MTNLDSVDRRQAEHLSQQFEQSGMLVVADVELPPSFDPSCSDVVFLRQNGLCEVFINSRIAYTGASPEWQRIQSAPELPGNSRLIASIPGGFISALAAVQMMLHAECAEAALSSGLPQPGGGALTDLVTVREALQAPTDTLYLDREALTASLACRIMGQESAISELAGVVARHCARRNPSRPAVVFAVGPTGVGKTRTAEALAEALRNLGTERTGYQFLRLDMNEYQEAHRVSQLTGAPQGYIGHGEGSQLVDALQSNPHTVVLFDEIEKAHPAILRLLMNAMDAGRIGTPARERRNRQLDCRKSIFLFTTNVDADGILDELTIKNGFGNRGIQDEVCRRRLLAAGVPAEIIGRVGRFLVFCTLSQETRASILALSVQEVAAEYGLNVSYIEPSVIVELMKRLGSDDFGARPERYLIDDELGELFAQEVRGGNLNPLVVCGPPFQCRLATEYATLSPPS